MVNNLSDMTNTNQFDVIVIGGGVAGLKCASKLYSKGIQNLIVLEAQNYLGGRIKTTTILGKNGEELPLEIGATWIHGHSSENPISRLVFKYPEYFFHKKDSFFNLDNKNVYFVDESGSQYDKEKCEHFYHLYNEWNLETKELWRTNQKTSHLSYSDFMRSKVEELIINYGDDEKSLYRALMERLLKAETAESGCATMDCVSTNEYGSYAIPDGDDFEYPGGFSKLIEFLANQIPESRIKLNTAVKNIRVENNDENTLIVECFNGNSFRTSHVVLTASLNYLKKNVKSLIQPSLLLSQKKLESIEKLKMDTVDKICLIYDDMSFYPENTNSIHPLFFNETKNKHENGGSIQKKLVLQNIFF